MTDKEETIEQFLKSCGANLKIDCSVIEDAGIETREYHYVITRKGRQLSGIYFAESGEKCAPTAYEILMNLPHSEPELDLFEFARNHDYRIGSQSEYDIALSAYKTYCHEWRGVNKLFGDIFEEFIELFKEETI